MPRLLALLLFSLVVVVLEEEEERLTLAVRMVQKRKERGHIQIERRAGFLK